MYRIALVNLPFAALSLPSFALSQLAARVGEKFRGRVEVEIHYLNHDFAEELGVDLYTSLATSLEAHGTGLGEWFFRPAAFPELSDNTAEYLERYYPVRNQETEEVVSFLQEKQGSLTDFLRNLVSRYRLGEADLVGLTSMFSQNTACFALSRTLKEEDPDSLIVMGGANCEAPMGPEIVRNVDSIDFVFSGPGLVSFCDFIERCLDDDSAGLHTLQGVHSAENAGSPAQSGRSSLGQELPINDFVRVDYGSFVDTLEKRFPGVRPVLLFETSRGCWWGERAHCTFCGLNGQTMAYRALKPELAIGLFNELFSFSPQASFLQCVDNIMPRDYLTEVFPRLDPPPGTTIYYEVKADLKEGELAQMARAGVREIQPGIEALATSTLKLMKKGTTAFQNIRFLKNCLKFGITPDWNLLVGFPGEEEEIFAKYENDLPLMTHLPPPNGVSPVRFDRYSPYFTMAEDYSLDLAPSDYYRLIYPFADDSLSRLAYYFSDQNLDAAYRQAMRRWVGVLSDLVVRWRARWFKGRSRPKLYLRESDGERYVFDTRRGFAEEHEIGEQEVRVLSYLDNPRSVRDIDGRFQNDPAIDAAGVVGRLRESGLLFEENGRFLSLIAPADGDNGGGTW